jgi:hypothetical protein
MSTTETESAQLLRQADPASICEWSHTNHTKRHTPSAGVVPADLLVPSYWIRPGNAGVFVQNDIIRCIPPDSSWFVELLVRDVGPEGVIMFALRGGHFEGSVAPPGASTHAAGDGYSFYYAGPIYKWQVLREDGGVLTSNCATQEEAAVWLKSYREMLRQTTKGRP